MSKSKVIMEKGSDENGLCDHRLMRLQVKQRVLKQWVTFFQGGFQWRHFSTDLYKHLYQHCGFIAHYNKLGFHNHYFQELDTERAENFMKQFGDPAHVGAECASDYWLYGDTAGDLNRAMCRAFEPHYHKTLELYVRRLRGSISNTGAAAPPASGGLGLASPPRQSA